MARQDKTQNKTIEMNNPKIQIRDEPHTYTDWKPKTHKIITGRIYMIQDQIQQWLPIRA